ncbi:CsbD family protein [Acaryochloris sp. 'Moss Beach']|uniref:CsbD family protein n=1 Tax=Acaryochloris TaxID=155977 RepID=UPI001BAE7A26|nr:MULTISPECIES: CsbD family protein [Acaryochloris]QUY44284.1 CsbD family protein [Acaryochloris marina S15]UJB69029.1 CsbD family protein [Acaryochloris sp. 'Moss Beach']
MSIEDRVNATVKNLEGKGQEVMGDLTGNPQDREEGRAKQSEAAVQHTVENIKDDIKQAID